MVTLICAKDGVSVSEKDVETMVMLANGFRAGRIAQQQGISRRSVESRLNILRSKTEAKTLPELVAIFMRNGLID